MNKSNFFSGQPIFSQLLKLIPKDSVLRIAYDTRSDHYCKRFNTYEHLVTMLYSIFNNCNSIREVRFIDIQLLYTHLTSYEAFSLSLTTTTFNRSSIRWFVQSASTACTIGRLSSYLQNLKNSSLNFNSWHTCRQRRTVDWIYSIVKVVEQKIGLCTKAPSPLQTERRLER